MSNNHLIKGILLILAVVSLNWGYAQQTISGKVTDANSNQPLIGASIVIKGTTKGTITDTSGLFKLKADRGNTLKVSYVGYQAKEIQVTAKTSYKIALMPGKGLEEFVVVGYGTQEKTDVTGAVERIKAEDLNEGSVTNPLQQIKGRSAGVDINQVGSEPGSTPTVRIRGITSLMGGNDPLVVVDGVQGNMDLLNQVPPSEIESIDILKDASATAVYGSRGAPGVIIVTTKKSREGDISIEYNGTMSADFLANELDVFNASQWRQQARKWGVPYSADHGASTDWYDLLTQTGMTQNHTLAFGGGADNFSYRASVSAILQDGLVINSDNQKYIARIRAKQKAFDDKLTLTLNLNNTNEKSNWSPTGVGRADFQSNLISNAYVAKPTDPVLNQDGSYFYDDNVFQYINPYAVAQEVDNEGSANNLFGSLDADLELTENLTFGWFGSWRKVDRNSGYFAPYKSTLPVPRDYNGVANVNTNLQDEKLMNMTLNYKETFDKHRIKFDGLYEWQKQTYQGHFAQGRDFINDITSYHALQLGSVEDFLPGDISSYKNDRKLVSFMGRVNYSYDNKYILTASFRRDGSSVFGTDHKWGNFPSASLAWRVTQEPFMEDQDLFSNLKLRVGYGVTGNQQGLYPQQSKQLVGASGQVYFNGNLITNFAVTQNANEDLRWETRYQTNVGIDFGLLEGRLSGSLDAFVATTENLLFNYSVPQPPYPHGSIVANVGSLKNEGIELALDYKAISTENVTLSLGGNVSLSRNEVLSLSGSIDGIPLNTNYVGMGYNAYLIEGEPIGTFNILEHSGKDASNEETVVDQNGDGIIDQGSQSPDRYMAGSALPTYTFAFTPKMTYKNFDLSMVWSGSGGNMIYNSIRSSFSYFEKLGKSNLLESAKDLGLFTSEYGSDLWLEKGDYVRFENLTIGYTINTENLKYIKSLRLSVIGNNLAVFTGYTGLDPEVDMSGSAGSGADTGIYPRTRSVSLGLNINF